MPLDALKQVQLGADQLEQSLQQPVENALSMPDEDDGWMPRLGDSVWLETLKTEGTVIELDREEAVVQIGALKIRAKQPDMKKPTRSERKTLRRKYASAYEPAPEVVVPRPASPGLELDLRGARVEEAVERLDNYIDAAYLSGLPFARIIHGKGTGALRKAVLDRVRDHALISKVVPAPPKEGGDGVTIIYMVSQT
jgi:DNA mismatch repair protein MutS2